MTWLAPGYLMAGLAAAAAVLALHLIVTREPRTVTLPTARFAADVTALARPRALTPSNIALLIVRMLIVLAAAAALARPVMHPARRPLLRIVLADRSAAVGNPREVDDSVRAIVSGGDSVVAFDSTGISAALIRGLRAAGALRDRADSFELVIVSPVARGQMDEATDSIRALWPGRIRIVRVEAREARETGEATVSWPQPLERSGQRPVYGVIAGGVTVVAPMTRDSAPPVVPAGARVVARWLDGEPAAWEVAAGGGCERTVRIGLPIRGDLALTPRFQRFAAILNGPCGDRFDGSPADAARLAGVSRLTAASEIARPEEVHSPWMRRLLALAGLLLAVEWMMRRRAGMRPAPAEAAAI